MDLNCERLWESMDSVVTASLPCSSEPSSPQYTCTSQSYLAEFFNFKSDGKHLVNDLSFNHDNSNSQDLNDVDWLDQKIDLQLFEDALQGESFADIPLLSDTANVEPLKDDLSTINVQDLATPLQTFTSNIVSAPSSPEQFVPNSNFSSPPESPVNDKFMHDFTQSSITIDILPLLQADQSDQPSVIEVLVADEPRPKSKKNSLKAKNAGAGRKKRGQLQAHFLDASEKRQRKMVQNKTAATRYRQKKRVITDGLTHEKEVLEAVNAELHSKVDSISSEIRYLKRLLREAFVAKGVLKDVDATSDN